MKGRIEGGEGFAGLFTLLPLIGLANILNSIVYIVNMHIDFLNNLSIILIYLLASAACDG
jgi:hypothetical protein